MPEIPLLADAPAAAIEDAGLGALRTERGNLPLDRLDIRATITGLVAGTELTQEFVNTFDVPLEATYVFPLPDRAAVTKMKMEADGRVVEGVLKERAEARAEYEQAIEEGRRASIAEEERPDVFTMRIGNIVPGERVTITLGLAGPLAYEDGEATYRFPLVVAPRYIPGSPLPGTSVGDGTVPDTDQAPDASRITPPVLLPGFPNPVRLSIEVDVDAAGLELGPVRSSLHAITHANGRIAIRPGERVDRDFILRLAYGHATSGLTLVPDDEGDEGTFQLTVLPPATTAAARPRDVVLVLDRSGSMGGWKIVAARRAAARIIDSLGSDDRFALLSFDHEIDRPQRLPGGLIAASDRHRYRAVEHLARLDARGGTEMLEPLREAAGLLTDTERDRVLVLVTDGQVGNEDGLIATLATRLDGIRVHTVGVDQAVNAGFLGRLATLGGGRCELVESEDRLDEAMAAIHRRIGTPLATDLALRFEEAIADTIAPARLPDLMPGVPLVIAGRYRGAPAAATLASRSDAWSATATGTRIASPALHSTWARAHLRDLEDRYVAGETTLEQRIVETSLRHKVLCRFTAFVAIDTRVVNERGEQHRVTQPVELPSGWESPDLDAGFATFAAPMMPAPAPAMAAQPMMARARAGGAPKAPKLSPMVHAEKAARQLDPMEAIRQTLEDEARRLRDLDGAPETEKRDALSDLASRLTVLLATVPAGKLTGLRELLPELQNPPQGEELEDLWQRTLAMLQPERERRRAFWKR